MEYILWIAVLVLSGLLLISIISPLFNPSGFWIPAFFGLAFPYIAALTIVLALIMSFFSFKKALLPILVLIAGFSSLRHTLNLTGSKNSFTISETDLKILSQNVHVMGIYGTENTITVDSVLSVISTESPDIACFQEFYLDPKYTGKDYGKFKEAGLFDYYAYTLYADSTSDKNLSIITFSRYPIVNQGVVRTSENTHRNIFSLWCDIELNNTIIRLYNVHLRSIGFTENEESLFNEKEQTNKELEKSSKSTIRKLKRAFIARSKQVEVLAAHIDTCKYPVFIAGDFNDTPVSYAYRKLRKNLNDAFLDSGCKGMGRTYNGIFPSFRIDYIFYPKQFEAAGFKIIDKGYSDHFPISCRFRIKTK
jgi:endonuclease/exonuclease/phosphatase family metal-dependent hydrolase